MNPVVKMVRSEVKAPISPPSELGVSSRLEEEEEEEDGLGEENKVRMKRMPYVNNVRVCSPKIMTVNTAFDARNVRSGQSLFVRPIGEGSLSERGVRYGRHLFTATAVMNNFIMKYYT